MKKILFLILIALCCPLVATAVPHFPINISADGRHLEDAAGAPFIIHADTPWSLIVQIPIADVEIYLEDRRQKGFNTLIINLIEHAYGDKAPNLNNAAGTPPFFPAGNLANYNAAYFDYAAQVIDLATQKGFLLLLTPSYFGYGGGYSGWWSEITSSGPNNCRAYGQFLGQRFRSYSNIIWVLGGDYSPPRDSVGELNAVEMANGIVLSDREDRLFTFHGVRRTNAIDQINFRRFVKLNAVYSPPDAEVYQRCIAAYSVQTEPPLPATLPTFIFEAYYENEHAMTPYRLRQQAYWAVTSCTAGQAFGNAPIWYFGAREAVNSNFADNNSVTWQQALNWPGSYDQKRLIELVNRFQAFKLIPDNDHQAIAATTNFGAYGSNTYSTTGINADRSLSITYLPILASHTVNLSWFSSPVYLYWYDPTSGALNLVAGSPFANTGSRVVSPPGNNQAGSSDWVLVASIVNRIVTTRPSPPRNLDVF